MIHGPAHPAAHHSTKYYLVVATLVVAGIFLLLQANSGDETITGSVVGFDGKTSDILTSVSKEIMTGTKKLNEEGIPIISDYKMTDLSVINYDFSLSLDNIPRIDQGEIETEEIVITFTDLSTKIKVDREELSLNDLEDVTLTIREFDGSMIIDETGLSVNGMGKNLMINGITLSTKDTMAIAFDYLNFETIQINSVSINELSFDKGDGTVVLKDKLEYELDEESVSISGFDGDITFDRDEETTYIGGNVNSISIDGLLELQVN